MTSGTVAINHSAVTFGTLKRIPGRWAPARTPLHCTKCHNQSVCQLHTVRHMAQVCVAIIQAVVWKCQRNIIKG